MTSTSPSVRHQAVRRFVTGVGVVTVWHGDAVQGTTVSSVTAISGDPLLIGVCLRTQSSITQVLHEARRFAVNVLSAAQASLAGWFADPGRPRGLAQFDHFEWEPDAFSGAPWISGSLASMGCHLTGGVPIGDHNLLFGEVITARTGEGVPLLHFAGQLHDGMLRVLPREATHPPIPAAVAAARTRTLE
jgi:flavin reductase (DIM6/NTAB) family NADH-FMN oxidoreductase RutF